VAEVGIVEVGPRDGLQNDPAELTTAQKVALVTRVVDAGVRRVEVASFVNPKLVPQMADAEAVCAGLPQRDGVSYIGLVLNARGFDRLAATGRVHEANVVVVSTDTSSERNQGMSTAESLRVAAGLVPGILAAGIVPTVTLAASFGCPYEGDVAVGRTVELARACADAGFVEVALADTIGAATPYDVAPRVDAVRAAVGDAVRLRAHFHNTRNTGYANAVAALDAGIPTLDASLGGIGGCPFAPKATGNIATDDLVHLLHRGGHRTGIDLDALLRTTAWLEEQLGRPVPGLISKAGAFPKVVA
jgi:hydroxymethylglutaryl-CoA lyase